MSLDQICELSYLQQTVNFGYDTSKEKKGQQHTSGPCGFQLDYSQCDVLWDTLFSAQRCSQGEKTHHLLLLCQVMNNQGEKLRCKSVVDLNIVRIKVDFDPLCWWPHHNNVGRTCFFWLTLQWITENSIQAPCICEMGIKKKKEWSANNGWDPCSENMKLTWWVG